MRKIVAILLLGFLCTAAFAQELTIAPAFKTDQYLPRAPALELTLNRPLTAGMEDSRCSSMQPA